MSQRRLHTLSRAAFLHVLRDHVAHALRAAEQLDAAERTAESARLVAVMRRALAAVDVYATSAASDEEAAS